MCCVETSKPPSKALVMPAKGFNSQVPRVQTSSITNAKPKPAKCFNSQVPRSLQNCFQLTSATQRPVNCFNSQVPGKLAKCFNPQFACKLLQCTSAKNFQTASNHKCQENLQTASTHRCTNKGLDTASIPTSQENLRNAFNSQLLANCLKSQVPVIANCFNSCAFHP